MRKEKTLIGLLRGLVNLLAEESARNPEFAGRVDALLSDLPERKGKHTKSEQPASPEQLPDIHAEWNARGDAEFRLWLRDQPTSVLRAVIRAQDLDPTRRTIKWREPEKLADFIADGLSARLSRGSAFIRGRSGENPD
jgi:hypothetical protein